MMAVVPMSRKPRFKKITDKGFETLREASENPIALRLYLLLCQYADIYNILVAPVAVLAEEIGCHERTARKAIKWLEAKGFVVLVRVGTARAFVLDPQAIWSTVESQKKLCVFDSKVLARNDATLKKRLTVMIAKQKELFAEEPPKPKKATEKTT